MSPQALEVADIFRTQGQVWRQAHAGHISLDQLKVMSAIETCRSAALGGHVFRCSACEHQQIAYNSCRNRHCPRCQGSAAHRWLEARQADLLPVEYYHLVFTLPAPLRIAIPRPIFAPTSAPELLLARPPIAAPFSTLPPALPPSPVPDNRSVTMGRSSPYNRNINKLEFQHRAIL